MHAFSRKAATAALAASKQKKFSEFHKRLFLYQKNLNDNTIREIAREIGLNMEQFEQDMIDPKIQEIIDKDLRESNQARIESTPTVFVNGKLLRDISIQGFEQAIETELRKKK